MKYLVNSFRYILFSPFKKSRVGFFVYFIFLVSFNSSHSQITSKNDLSGKWTENNTWIGGVVPDTSSIYSNVVVFGIFRETEILVLIAEILR